MSFYVVVKIKHINQNDEKAVELLEMMTTPARELVREVWGFTSYTEGFEYLETELLEDVIKFYESQVAEYEQIIADYYGDLQGLDTYMKHTRSPEIFEKLQYQYASLMEQIQYADEDLMNYKFWLYKWRFVRDVANLNDFYELIYYTG